MLRWFLSAILACAVAPRALAAPPPPGGTQVELVRGEDDPEDRSAEEELRLVEARVAELRDRISRTKARLAALQELVTGEDVSAGARAVVRQKNELTASFVLESVTWAIDGAPVFTETNARGELEKKAALEVFTGRLDPGHHVLGVQLVYRAAGPGSDAQRVKVEATHAFDAQSGRVTLVEARAHEKVAPKLEGRPAVSWRVESEPERADGPAGGGSGRK